MIGGDVMSAFAQPVFSKVAVLPRPSRSAVRVGILNAAAAGPAVVARLVAGHGDCRGEPISLSSENDFGALAAFGAMLVVDEGDAASGADAIRRRNEEQITLLRKRRIGAVVLTRRPWAYSAFQAGVICLSPDAPADRIEGALVAMAHLRPVLREVDKQVQAMQRLGRSLQKRFEATDRELNLAAKLQRDFLPQDLPQIGRFRFSSLFRPCSWVSGDIFDVFRLDETHWGFYLADAVGHGVAAGLLTMYIKHAIRPKRVTADGYELVPPNEVLAHLNDLLVSQGLTDSQFITGWYGLLDTESGVLRYAVAGHPPALLINASGEIRELFGDGCLIGLTRGENFSLESVRLQPGDRVIVYSDGLEPVLLSNRPPLPQVPTFEEGIPATLCLPQARLMEKLRERLDTMPGSLAQADDVTALILDVAGGD